MGPMGRSRLDRSFRPDRGRILFRRGRGGSFICVLPNAAIALRFADECVDDVSPLVAGMDFYRRLPPSLIGSREGRPDFPESVI